MLYLECGFGRQMRRFKLITRGELRSGKMITFRIVAAAIVLAVCGVPALAGTWTTAGPSAVGAQAVRYGSAYLRIKVPPPAKSSPSFRGIHPLYVSPSTKSIAVDLDGSRAVTKNVNPAGS